MVLDHIGILVPRLEPAIERWETFFGYRRNSDIILNTRQKVRVVFLSKRNSLMIKLFEPSAPDSPVYRAARNGGGLHHLCFRCAELSSQIRLLQRQGATLVVPPQPGEAFRNQPIAFLFAGDHFHFELIDTTEKCVWHNHDVENSLEGVLP